MSARFAYFYLMGADAARIRSSAPAHVEHWRTLALADYLGGPFGDRSGGLITFRADDVRDAERMVSSDPFFIEGLLDSWTLKEWAVDGAPG